MNSAFDVIADGLAEKGYAIVDQFLSPREVQNILSTSEFQTGLESFRRAGIGQHQSQQIQEGIRGDFIQWLDKDHSPAAIQVYLNRLKDMIQYLNSTLFLSLKDFEVHLTIYPTGSFYRRHLDQFRRDDHRKLSVICYLNSDWKEEYGGQLRMYLDEPLTILPLAGRLICFRSDQIEHEVLPSTRPRYSITGWILDRLVELKHL